MDEGRVEFYMSISKEEMKFLLLSAMVEVRVRSSTVPVCSLELGRKLK